MVVSAVAVLHLGSRFAWSVADSKTPGPVRVRNRSSLRPFTLETAFSLITKKGKGNDGIFPDSIANGLGNY